MASFFERSRIFGWFFPSVRMNVVVSLSLESCAARLREELPRRPLSRRSKMNIKLAAQSDDRYRFSIRETRPGDPAVEANGYLIPINATSTRVLAQLSANFLANLLWVSFGLIAYLLSLANFGRASVIVLIIGLLMALYMNISLHLRLRRLNKIIAETLD